MEKKQKIKSFSNSVEKLLKYNKVCYNINRGEKLYVNKRILFKKDKRFL